MLSRKRNAGMGAPVATVFWLAPVTGFTLAFVRIAVEGWGNVFIVPLRETPERTVRTLGLAVLGSLAVAMVLSEYSESHTYLFCYFPEISQLLSSIIKRAGVVPMSISDIFKEVTTISVPAWVFGEELAPSNILGGGITFVGVSYYPARTSSIYQ